MKSRYVIHIGGLSKYTRCSDLRKECERYGSVMTVERDAREREALVEFKHSADAADAYEDLEGLRFDDRKWRVDWATPSDFKFFGWSWFEGNDEDDYQRGRKDDHDNKGFGGGGNGGGSRNPSPSPLHDRSDSARFD